MKNFAASLIVLLVTLLVCFAGLEFYVRATQSTGENFDIEMWRYAKDLKQVSTISGVGHEHVPDTSGIYMGVPVVINSVGWRDTDYSLEKPDGATRIMMLGDSVTFGWGAPPDAITSNLLEERLNTQDSGRLVEVLNTGVGNTNTAMQVTNFLAKGKDYKPDIVVLNYFINDAEPTPKRKQNWLVDWSYAAVFLAGRIDILKRSFFGTETWLEYYANLYNDDRPGWTAAKAAIKQLIEYCKAEDIKLAIVNYPELHELDPYPFENVNAALQKASSLPVLDLTSSVKDLPPESLWVTKTDAHPNKRAATRFAEAIDNHLKEQFPELLGPVDGNKAAQ